MTANPVIKAVSSISAPIKIFVYGLTGKMGKEIKDLVSLNPTLEICGTSRSAPHVLSSCHVAVDFSHPHALETTLNEAVRQGTPLLIGTTGLSADHEKLIKLTSKRIPIFYTANTSLGIAVLNRLVRIAAQLLDDAYDIEIFETHHRYKVDAPSGTAITLGKSAALGRGIDFQEIFLNPDRSGARAQGTFGFSVQRGGGACGEHKIRFMGDEEVLELSHTSYSRRLLARGALKAALWVKDQKPGLYTMEDMLG